MGEILLDRGEEFAVFMCDIAERITISSQYESKEPDAELTSISAHIDVIGGGVITVHGTTYSYPIKERLGLFPPYNGKDLVVTTWERGK